MSTTPTLSRRRIAFILAIAAGLTLGGVALASVADTGAAQSDVSVDSLSIADAERTVDGGVSDVTLTADLAFEHEVPDAETRMVTLRVGPDTDSLRDVTFDRVMDVSGTDSGTVTLSGSLMDAGFETSDFAPPTAGTTEQTVVVEAVVEIDRANGETVTRTATDTATITIHDDGTITASVGGSGEFTVQT